MKLSAFTAIVLTTGAPQIMRAAKLQPTTLAAGNAYVEEADSQAQERVSRRLPLFWMTESPIARCALRCCQGHMAN